MFGGQDLVTYLILLSSENVNGREVALGVAVLAGLGRGHSGDLDSDGVGAGAVRGWVGGGRRSTRGNDGESEKKNKNRNSHLARVLLDAHVAVEQVIGRHQWHTEKHWSVGGWCVCKKWSAAGHAHTTQQETTSLSPAHANLASLHVEDVGRAGVTGGEVVVVQVTHVACGRVETGWVGRGVMEKPMVREEVKNVVYVTQRNHPAVAGHACIRVSRGMETEATAPNGPSC